MAAIGRLDHLRRRRRRRHGLAGRRLRRLAADRPAADLPLTVDKSLLHAAGRRSAGTIVPGDIALPAGQGHAGAGRADPALPAAGADPDLPAQGPARHAGGLMTEPAPPNGGSTTSSPTTSAAGWSGACSRWCCCWRRCCGPAGFAHTMLSQMGIAIIVCLSYNMLLGQGGMLSFGHAVYTGLGSFLAIHTLNLISAGKLAAAGQPGAAGRRPGRPGLRRAARLRDAPRRPAPRSR